MYKKYVVYFLATLILGCSALPDTKADLHIPDNPGLETIPLELTTHLADQQHFIEGDVIQFLLSLGSDAFIYMYHVDANNNINQILPDPKQSSNYYSSGYFLTIPEYDDGYRFTVSQPYGEQAIWVFASDQSITLINTPNSIESIRQKIRQSSNRAYGEHRLIISTHKKTPGDL